jgi:hypothetical protein
MEMYLSEARVAQAELEVADLSTSWKCILSLLGTTIDSDSGRYFR